VSPYLGPDGAAPSSFRPGSPQLPLQKRADRISKQLRLEKFRSCSVAEVPQPEVHSESNLIAVRIHIGVARENWSLAVGKMEGITVAGRMFHLLAAARWDIRCSSEVRYFPDRINAHPA
jgi:hypothetical protein